MTLPANTTPENIAVVTALGKHPPGCHATVRFKDGRVVSGGLLWRPLAGMLSLFDEPSETRTNAHVSEVASVENAQTAHEAGLPTTLQQRRTFTH